MARLAGRAGLTLGVVLALVVLNGFGFTGLDGIGPAAVAGQASDPVRAIPTANPITDGPHPLVALAGGALLLLGLALTSRRRA